MAYDIYYGTVGAFLRWTLLDSEGDPLDISNFTSMSVNFTTSDENQVVKPLTFSTLAGDAGDGTDGRVEYSTEADMWEGQARGVWAWQHELESPNWQGPTSGGLMNVGPRSPVV